MKKVLITTSSFGTSDPYPLEILNQNGFQPVLNPYKRKLTEEEVLSLLGEHRPEALIAGVEPLTERVLQIASPYLKVISRCGIGMDSVDLNAAKRLGIKVTNTPDAPTIPVAELTLGLILDALRGISLSTGRVKQGEWHRPMGNLLYKKIVGIVGLGRIGTHLAKLLEPFECGVLGYDPYIGEHPYASLTDEDTLLECSDIITLHIPYTEENRHFIGEKALSQIKSTAYLINTARGGLVDEAALYRALKEEKIKGCALDCFEEEPYTGPLKELDNVVLTGHIGSYAAEARIMQERQSAENVIISLRCKNEV